MGHSEVNDSIRLDQIPILHVRGTHFTVGYTIGRQFKSLITDVLQKSEYFQYSLLPEYESGNGKRVYEGNLQLCKRKFPGYVDEIQGMSKGADVPFHKLFLLNLEVFLTSPTEVFQKGDRDGGGCSSILSNFGNLAMGHTEDAGPELLNNVFIVSAEIVNEKEEQVEKFTTVTYAGCLPGYTMGFNDHGFVHSINTLYPLETRNDKSPRSFIARSLLKASNLEEVLDILRDKGTGIADGFSLNAYFAQNEGPPAMYNIEICPPKSGGDESELNVLRLNSGESYVHCNKFLRTNVPELEKASVSSVHRHKAIANHPKPDNIAVMKGILSDRSDTEYPVFRHGKCPDLIVTVAVGIFDISNRTWSIYTQPPNNSKPVAVIPMNFKGLDSIQEKDN